MAIHFLSTRILNRGISGQWINCFLELKGNHWFKDDPAWGELLQRFHTLEGLSGQDIAEVNKRVIATKQGDKGPLESDIPSNAVYAVKTNLDRNAINDGIFMKVLQGTHSKSQSQPCPNHTIVRASNLKWKKRNTRAEYIDFQDELLKDILFATCPDSYVKDSYNDS